MKMRWFACMSLMVLSVHSLALAAPVPKEGEGGGPQITIQAQSWDEVLKRFTDSVKSIVPAEEWKGFEQFVLPSLSPKQLPFIDSKKRFGSYISLHPKILEGQMKGTNIVLMIPVTSEAELLKAAENFRIKFNKQGELYSITFPEAPVELYARFAEGYCYLGVAHKESLDNSNLILPKDFFSEKDSAVATTSIRLDRIPKPIKDALYGGMGMIPLFIDKPFKRELAPLNKLPAPFFQVLSRRVQSLFSEASDVTIRMDLEPKSMGFIQEIVITPKEKTQLAESISRYKFNGNRFATLVGPDSAASALISMPLHTTEFRRMTKQTLTDFGHQIVQRGQREKAPTEAITFAETLFKSLAASAEKGEMDLALSLNGPSKEKQFTLVGAIQIEDTSKIDADFKAMVKIMPEGMKGLFKWDVAKAGKISIHQADIDPALAQMIAPVFGKEIKVHFAFGEGAVYASLGSDGVDSIKKSLEAKRAASPILQVRNSPKRLKTLIPEGASMGWAESALLSRGEEDLFNLQIIGGEKLTIRFSTSAMLPLGAVFTLGSTANATFEKVGEEIKKD